MKTSVLLLLLPCGTTAFQFMKGWKMPTVDPHQAEIEERFGDKSAFEYLTSFGVELVCVFNRIDLLTYFCLSCNLCTIKELVVLTGTSSGLGRKTAQALLRTGEYHVIGAVRE